MCSNFEPVKPNQNDWVKKHFACHLPNPAWPEETYPTYPAPFIYLDESKPKCGLAKFGLVPQWATDKHKFGLRTYNARSETAHQKPSYRSAWKERRFGLAIMNGFYEPNWETGKSERWRIYRADREPIAVASIWERFIDQETGEISQSFSMLTINADEHEVMQHFHKPQDEKRSIVVLQDADYLPWLHAGHDEAIALLRLAPAQFLQSEPAPKEKAQQTLGF